MFCLLICLWFSDLVVWWIGWWLTPRRRRFIIKYFPDVWKVNTQYMHTDVILNSYCAYYLRFGIEIHKTKSITHIATYIMKFRFVMIHLCFKSMYLYFQNHWYIIFNIPIRSNWSLNLNFKNHNSSNSDYNCIGIVKIWYYVIYLVCIRFVWKDYFHQIHSKWFLKILYF